MPPQKAFQLVVFMLGLQNWNSGHGVIGDPEPVGESIGDNDVNSVVSPG